MGPLLTALGVALFGSVSAAMVAAAAKGDSNDGPLSEVVISAATQSDTEMTAKVLAAIRGDPFLFSDHVSVVTENGVVRLEGVVTDVAELQAILRVVRRSARGARIVDQIDYIAEGDEAD